MLTRDEEATRLEIQYTYDSAIIAAKLAELTYQENMESLEEELQSVKDELAELQETLETLKAMTDGIVTAGTAGTVAAVNYEADDLFSQDTAPYSIYNTDTVQVAIAVSQYDIADISVGDTVNVQISGMMNLDGTITEKVSEPTDGTSRTEIIYEVEVSLDNSRGRLSSGLAAVVTVDTEEAQNTENTEQNAEMQNTENAEQSADAQNTEAQSENINSGQ